MWTREDRWTRDSRGGTMGALKVEAVFGTQKLVDGSDTTATLCVSVTDDGGQPATGLGIKSFKVDVIQSEVVGGEAGDIYQPIEIASVYAALTPGGTSGFYHVNLKPLAEFRWGRSRIVVGLAVSRGRIVPSVGSLPISFPKMFWDVGQTLIAFEVT